MSDRITANLPARDLDETEAFYARLGFEPHFRGDDWMILGRGPLELELFPHPELDPASSWHSACVRVADVDALYAEWSALGLPEEGIPRLQGPPWIGAGLRMFAVVDPNGSLLRVLGEGRLDVAERRGEG